MSAKQKIVHGHGPSNINLGIFDIYKASQLFPSSNYGRTERDKVLKQTFTTVHSFTMHITVHYWD